MIFLGGTIGNLQPDAPVAFCARSPATRPRRLLLLGIDLDQGPGGHRGRLQRRRRGDRGVQPQHPAGGQPAGRRRLRPRGLPPPRLLRLADHRIEMRLDRRRAAQRVHLAASSSTLMLAAGEEIRTEISAKYDRRLAAELLAEGGFRPGAGSPVRTTSSPCRWRPAAKRGRAPSSGRRGAPPPVHAGARPPARRPRRRWPRPHRAHRGDRAGCGLACGASSTTTPSSPTATPDNSPRTRPGLQPGGGPRHHGARLGGGARRSDPHGEGAGLDRWRRRLGQAPRGGGLAL